MVRKNGKRPGGVAGPHRGANDFTNQTHEYNAEAKEREEGNYSPSGHREPRESRTRGRAKKLAETWAFQSVGDASYWEEYMKKPKKKSNGTIM
jgi:hypothetical protein